MRKVLLILTAFLLTTSLTLAAPPADSTPPGQIEKEVKDKIEDLKERVATRVAELRAKSKRAFFGQIKEKRENTLTLARGEKEQSVALDEETTIVRLGPNKERAALDLEALEIGEWLVVFGTLDLNQKTLLAKKILARTLPKNIHGKVTEVDIDSGTLTLAQNGGTTYVVDYEIRTRCRLWLKKEGLLSESEGFANCGLSRIEIGDRVFVRGTVNQKDDNRLTALRLLLLPAQQPTILSPSPTQKE